MSKPILDQKTVRELLDYNPDTGEFRWRQRDRKWFATEHHCNTWNTRFAGKVAGNLAANGYWHMCILYRQYWAHRLAWLWVYGSWPKKCIDHIDENPLNNAIENLRDVTRRVNQQNQKSAQNNNKCGLRGVHWEKKRSKWCAKIKAADRTVHIGYFPTAEEARLAYLEVKALLHEGHVQ